MLHIMPEILYLEFKVQLENSKDNSKLFKSTTIHS